MPNSGILLPYYGSKRCKYLDVTGSERDFEIITKTFLENTPLTYVKRSWPFGYLDTWHTYS